MTPLTKEQLRAAKLLADGASLPGAAAALKRSEATVRGWLKLPALHEAYRAAVLEAAVHSYARALKRLNEQMDDENPQVAQRAAKELLDRFEEAVMGAQEREIVVRVEGMPPLGMPPPMDGETAGDPRA